MVRYGELFNVRNIPSKFNGIFCRPRLQEKLVISERKQFKEAFLDECNKNRILSSVIFWKFKMWRFWPQLVKKVTGLSRDEWNNYPFKHLMFLASTREKGHGFRATVNEIITLSNPWCFSPQLVKKVTVLGAWWMKSSRFLAHDNFTLSPAKTSRLKNVMKKFVTP